jgi:hypothetical protein
LPDHPGAGFPFSARGRWSPALATGNPQKRRFIFGWREQLAAAGIQMRMFPIYKLPIRR